MEHVNAVILGVAALLTAINIGPILTKLVRSKRDTVDAINVSADTDSIQVKTAKEVVEMVRGSIIEKEDTIRSLISRLDRTEARVEALERRETGYIERITQLQAYAFMSYAQGLQYNKEFPVPPFLKDEIDHIKE